ncbi:MAG: DUF1836 domain-containing protein [Lachnospirales bacterium]
MKNIIYEALQELLEKNIVKSQDIPNIDLYVDQVTGFIEENSYQKNNEKTITKSMINNYCKNKVIPSSNKKKYTKNHIMLLILIHNTKNILSISDLSKIFSVFDENSGILSYYNDIMDFMSSFDNENFYNSSSLNFEHSEEKTLETEDYALLATKLAIEANIKKILAEIIIDKYL